MKKTLNRFDIREKTGLIVIVILVWLGLSLAFAFLVNVPRTRKAADLEAALAHATGLLASKEDDVAKLAELHDRVLKGRESLDTFYADVLSTKKERLLSFVKEIREIAVKFNINVENIGYPRQTFPKDKVTKFSAVVPLSGSYENLRQFVDTVERSQNFIIIESVELTSGREGGIILSLRVMLSTYFLDEEIEDVEGGRAARAG